MLARPSVFSLGDVNINIDDWCDNQYIAKIIPFS